MQKWREFMNMTKAEFLAELIQGTKSQHLMTFVGNSSFVFSCKFLSDENVTKYDDELVPVLFPDGPQQGVVQCSFTRTYILPSYYPSFKKTNIFLFQQAWMELVRFYHHLLL